MNGALELIFGLGLSHEKTYLEKLRGDGPAVVEITENADLATRVQLSNDVLRAGATPK